MKFVKMYWTVAGVIGTLVIILYTGQTVMEAAQWVAVTLQKLAGN